MSDDLATWKHLYRQMLAIRRMEEAAAKAYLAGKIGGFLHLYIGQEAVAVGAIAAIHEDDYVVAAYREHGHAYAKGMSARAIMAELFGKGSGCSRGMGGSMHLFDAGINFLGGYGIVGGQIPLGAGVAFKAKYKDEGRVCLCFTGEGGVNMGGFHEGLSIASLWRLPVVFIVENNLYSMGTPLYRTIAVEDVTARAAGYGMERDRFDADDVLHVRDRIRVAVDRARAGEGPTLIEARCYRFRGHSMSDPAKYRTKDEVEEHRRRDAVPRMRQLLLDSKVPEEELAALEEEIKQEIEDAVKFADESPEPDVSLAGTTVYA